MTADDRNRWARIRQLLTPAEAALLFNACQDKANGDREAAGANRHEPGSSLAATLLAQADLADTIADQVLS